MRHVGKFKLLEDDKRKNNQSRGVDSEELSQLIDNPGNGTKARVKSGTNTIDKAFNNIKSLGMNGAQSREITETLDFMIAKDKLPLSFVENEGFTTFVKKLKPLYVVPSRRTVTWKNVMKF